MDIEEITEAQLRGIILEWRLARTARLDLDRQAAALKKDEDRLKSLLIEAYKAKQLEGQMVGNRVTGLTTRTVPVVQDKEAFLAHLRKTGELDLLEFRPSAKAIKDRWEAEVVVPGTEELAVYDLFDRQV